MTNEMRKCKNLWFCVLLTWFVTLQAQQELPKVAQGSLERHTDFSSKYVTPRTIDVWLPNGYSTKTEYAVLYMHDGGSLFDAEVTWNKQEWDVDGTMQSLLDKGLIKPTIVVGIHNVSQERHCDYFPQKPFESLPQKIQDSLLTLGRGQSKLFTKPVGSDDYVKFITEELKPFIDKTYSVKTDKNNTYIAGSSMGGLISWYTMSECPDIFGGAACLSTHWPGVFTTENNPVPDAFLNYLKEHLPKAETHKIYFDYGTETLDAMYGPYQLKVDALMVQKGYSEKNWKTLKFEGENHSENAWQKRLHIPLTFLLGMP